MVPLSPTIFRQADSVTVSVNFELNSFRTYLVSVRIQFKRVPLRCQARSKEDQEGSCLFIIGESNPSSRRNPLESECTQFQIKLKST